MSDDSATKGLSKIQNLRIDIDRTMFNRNDFSIKLLTNYIPN